MVVEVAGETEVVEGLEDLLVELEVYLFLHIL